MSRRSSLDLTLDSPNRTQKETLMAYFKKACSEAGIILNYTTSQPHVLSQEQSLVARDLEKHIKTNNTFYPNNVREFMDGLKVLCEKEKHYKKALMPTVLRKLNNIDEILTTTENNIQQESIFRIFLNVTSLQDEIIFMLLKKVEHHATIDEDDTSWVHHILNNLRYLPYFKSPEILARKLLDVLDVATYVSQIEIITNIPEVLPNNQFETAAKQLCELLDENPNLSGAIIDCLNFLNLKPEVQSSVQEKILSILSSGPSLKIFPILFEFLITDYKIQNLYNVLLKSRNALDSIIDKSNEKKETNVNKAKEVDSQKAIIISRLHLTALKSPIADGWINMMASLKKHTDHKPVDFIILFILHSTAKTHKKAVENLIRKHIRLGILKVALLEEMFEKYLIPYVLENFLSSIIAIGWSIIRNTDNPLFTDFAIVFYNKLFNHEYCGYLHRQDILNNLISLTGTNDQKHIGSILKILRILSENENRLLQKHIVHLMSILEILDNFNLANFKQLFEVLCSLLCTEQCDDSLSGLKDELHMLVRKQLASSKQIVRHRGIISSVVMAKHTASNLSDQSTINVSSDSIVSISDLPPGPSKEAAMLLDMTNKSVASSAVFKGIYYDELSSAVVASDKLDKNFIIWLQDIVTGNFQNIFVIEKIPGYINGLELSDQFALNKDDEIDEHIYINIGELTIKQHLEKKVIVTLAPYFRLLRLLHYKNNDGVLTNIDALLGCAVIMPNINDVDSNDTEQTKLIADCIFHCINWFRELISAFVTQKSKKLRLRVLDRINDIIALEKVLQEVLSNIPGHKLPNSYFENVSPSPTKRPEKFVRPAKRVKSSEIVNDSVASTSVVTQSTKSSKGKKTSYNNEMIFNFREIDTDVMKLLKYRLTIDDSSTSLSQLSQVIQIDLKQFGFILKDFVAKLKNITKGSTLSHFDQVEPKNFISDSVLLLPSIYNNFTVIATKLKTLSEETDEQQAQTDMFDDETNDLKTCFGLVLESFFLIWSWCGFQHPSNHSLLKESLKTTRNLQSQIITIKRLVNDHFNDLIQYTNQCLHITSAINLVKTIEALYNLNSSPELQKKLVAISGKLLNTRWYNYNGSLDSGKNFNCGLEYLVQIYLSATSVKTIYGLVGTLKNESGGLKRKEDHLQMLTSINKTNFHMLFKGLCTTLLENIHAEVASLTNSEHLELWQTSALTLQGLMCIVKDQQTRNNLAFFLKKGTGVLKVFLTHGVPILEIELRSKTDKVIEIFKAMQTNTRFLHHLCCHSKTKKDSSLLPLVPQFRLTLETLLYRVKAALVANNCSAAFWMGHLKNKDLNGVEILSQSTTITEEDDEKSADEDSDEEMDLDLGSGNSASASEVFE